MNINEIQKVIQIFVFLNLYIVLIRAFLFIFVDDMVVKCQLNQQYLQLNQLKHATHLKHMSITKK